MLDQKTITVGGEEFILQQLPTKKGLRLAARLSGLLSGSLEGILVDTAGSGAGNKVEINWSAAATGLLARIGDGEIDSFIAEMLRNSLVRPEYSEGWFDSRFSGAYGELAALVVEILMFNYLEAAELLKKKVAAVTGLSFSRRPVNGAESTPSS